MGDVFIFDAVRTPRGKGKPDGALAKVPPHELVAALVNALRERLGSEAVEGARRLLLGCVGQVGPQGGNIALVSRLFADLPNEMVAASINNYCVSALTAIGSAAASVAAEGGLALAGGVESMSQVPFLGDGASYYAEPLATDLRFVPVALAADLLATEADVGREELDAVSVESHRRAKEAWDANRFARAVVPVRDQTGTVVLSRDELVRSTLTTEAAAALPPAFAELGAKGYDDRILAALSTLERIEHRHSVANCPGIADGAGLVVLGGPDAAPAPRARIRAFAEASTDPIRQLTAGRAAMLQALARAGMALEDIEIIEFMEAFAVVPALFYREANVRPDRVNVDGGHLAMGHPMGASGAILVSQLIDVMERSDAGIGMAVAHGGAGVGAAIILERA